MSESKTATNKSTEPKYSTARLLKSKALSAYQQDFAKAVLKKDEYTIEEAEAEIKKALKKGAK